MTHDDDDESFDPNVDLDLSLLTSPVGPPPDCPMCAEPMKWNDGAYMCGDCNGMDCGPETG